MSTSEGTTSRVRLSLALLVFLGMTLDRRAAATRLPVFSSVDVAATARLGGSGDLDRVQQASETVEFASVDLAAAVRMGGSGAYEMVQHASAAAGCGPSALCASKRNLLADVKNGNGLYPAGDNEKASLLALKGELVAKFSSNSALRKSWQLKDTPLGGPHVDVQTYFSFGTATVKKPTVNYASSNAGSDAVTYIGVDYQTGTLELKNSKSYARVSMPCAENGLDGSAVNSIIMPCLQKSMDTGRQVTLFPAIVNSDGSVEIQNFATMSQTSKPTAWVAVLGTIQANTPTSQGGPGAETTFSLTSANEIGAFQQSVPTQMMVLGGKGKPTWVTMSGKDLAALMPSAPDAPGDAGGVYAGPPKSVYDSKNCRTVNRSLGGRTIRRRVCRKGKGSG